MNPRISLEVELRRQDRRLLEAGLDMDMRRPHVPGLAIVKRLDGAQRVASLVVGVELAAQEKARVVIASRVVRLPDASNAPLSGRPYVSKTRPVTVSGVPAIPF